MYQAYFYKDPDTQEAPAQKYLAGLSQKLRARFAGLIAKFKEEGRLPFPYTSHIQGSLWEIRIRESKDRHRVLYAIVEQKRILLLHGFVKRTAKTPKSEIVKAEHYLSDYHAKKRVLIRFDL